MIKKTLWILVENIYLLVFLITIGVKIFNDDDNSSLGKNKV
jgi:hypothetical protein